MKQQRYYTRAYGLDCLGNCTGWMVVDRTKQGHQDKNPCVQTFVGNIYEPEKRAQARVDAYALAARLNAE